MPKDNELYVMKIDYGREYPMHYVTDFQKKDGGYVFLSSNRKKAMEAPSVVMQELREWFLRRQIMYKGLIKEEDVTVEKADKFRKTLHYQNSRRNR